jgi:acyl carrier protein
MPELTKSALEVVRAEVAVLAQAVLPDDDASLFDAGVIDSWSLVDLIARLEEAFGVKVPDADMRPRQFESLRLIAEYFQARRGA